MVSAAAVWSHLQDLRDDQFGTPLSVVDVGLIHEVKLNGPDVYVSILMFNRGRVYIDAAASPIRQHLLRLEGVGEVVVECLWAPEWTPDRLSQKAREVLGFAAEDPVEGRMHVCARQKADAGAAPVDMRRLDGTRLCLGPRSLEVSSLPREKFAKWWGGWRFCKRFSLEETSGIPRQAEPVHLEVHFAPGQIREPAREVRVVEEESGVEIPCQVYGVEVDGEGQRCVVALLAQVPARARRSYLLLHGNASPACWPPFYATELVTRGSGWGLEIENSYYRARLSPVMGQLRNLEFRRWGQTQLGWEDPSPLNIIDAANDPKSKLDIAWHGEDLCIHWNPDFRNQLRYRMTNWPEPPHFQVDVGPVCTRVRRWGYPVCPTHPARAQEAVRLEVTYTFYNGLPYFAMESRLDVQQEADILVVRNDEWLFRAAFTHSLWMMEGGELVETPADQAVSLTQNPALVGFYHRDLGDGFASLRLAYGARGFPGAYDPELLSMGTTAYGNQIWARDVFHVAEELAIQPGAVVWEHNAYLCYNAREAQGNRQAADWSRVLRAPLKASTAEPGQ